MKPESDSGQLTETATLAAGCFWHIEDIFRRTPGVVSTEVGYMGGRVDNPTYEQVCGGQTGHAEACQVTYDPEVISYKEILDKFFSSHDPTQLNRQGPDVGSQYRSAIFYHSAAQAKAAQQAQVLAGQSLEKPIVTEISEASTFWRAEEYHQCYLTKRY